MSGRTTESRAAWVLRLAREAAGPGTDPLRRRYARQGLASAARHRLPAPLRARMIGPASPGADRYDAGFPPAWRDEVVDSASSVCVVVDAALAGQLGEPPLPGTEGWDLLVLDRGTGHGDAIGGQWANVVRLDVPQRLRPGWTLVALAHVGLLDSYQAVLHIGSSDGLALAAPDVAERVLKAFRDDPKTGIVTSTVRPRGAQRSERRLARRVLARLEIDVPRGPWNSPGSPSFWTRAFLLQGLRALDHTLAELLSGRETDDLLLVLGALAAEAGCHVETCADLSEGVTRPTSRPRGRIVPFYLPQFHPTVENDRWWGRGFTEWTNVTAARPVYSGHRQPRLPQDLGFYDLRLDETRHAQADLARSHGVAGFLYYHYWFSGRRILEGPLDALVAGNVDCPFAIMWANENWTRAWDGGEASVLLEQDYSDGAAEAFIEDVLPYLRDHRYLRVGGKPLLSVYRAGRIPELASVVAAWRRRAAQEGMGLFVVAVDVPEAFGGLEGGPGAHGIDAVMGFPPHRYHWAWASSRGRKVDPRFEGHLWSYSALVRADEVKLREGLPPDRFPTVMAGFDNTPRRQWSSTVFMGANPYTFRRWLASAVEAVAERPVDRRLVFVNAWNEWAEGAVLEPDARFGRSYLHAIRDVVGVQTS